MQADIFKFMTRKDIIGGGLTKRYPSIACNVARTRAREHEQLSQTRYESQILLRQQYVRTYNRSTIGHMQRIQLVSIHKLRISERNQKQVQSVCVHAHILPSAGILNRQFDKNQIASHLANPAIQYVIISNRRRKRSNRGSAGIVRT